MISEPELEGADDGPPDGSSRTVPPVPAPRAGGGVPGASAGFAGFDSSAAFRPPSGSGSAVAPGAVGGAGTGTGAETISGQGLPRVPSRRGPWLWALGGAVVSSAVWAAGLYAYGTAGPDLGGYRVSANLCLDAELPALSGLLGKRQFPMAAVDEQLAIDRASCTLALTTGRRNEVKNDTRPVPYTRVDIEYARHKRTDPGPEFDATVTRLAPEGALERRVLRIPDLGERAYLVTDPSGESPELKVLDGQAVLTIAVNRVANYAADPVTGHVREPERPDFSGVEPAMIEDMRDLMAALKR
ncbi:hypothetical protein ACFYYH_04990 [Streptomyces sp. NPDC002018]|uniref:hypothetical protein n=1 Tax=Streptomyces sp. NPDC002018 TaxID=3364629 RepID=UPI0036864494